MNKLIFVGLCLLTYISCNDICREDGLIANREDNTSYIECRDGTYTFMRCPHTEDGLAYKVFDGIECVDSRGKPQQTSEQSTHQNPDLQSDDIQADEPARSEENIVCPFGATYDNRRGKCIMEDFADPIVVEKPDFSQPECPSGHTYDKELNKCRALEYADPIPVTTPEYECPKPNGRFPDPRDDKCYFICENNLAHHLVCPGDAIFSGGDNGKCLNSLSDDIMVHDSPQRHPQPRQAPGGNAEIYCEPGTVYVPQTRMCRKEELIDPIAIGGGVSVQTSTRCPIDTTYDPATGQCTKVIAVAPIRSQTQISGSPGLVCLTGYEYEPSIGMCRKYEYVNPNQRAHPCPIGHFYDNALTRCIPWEPDTGSKECSTEYCPDGYTLDRRTGNCSSKLTVPPIIQPGNITYTCDPQYKFDWVLHKCLQCNEIDPESEETGGGYKCPDHFNHQTRHEHVCTRSIWIPSIIPEIYKNCTCPPGYDWRPHMFKCVRIHTENCIKGACPPITTHVSYRPSPALLPSNYNCPSGYAYDNTLGECRSETPFNRRRPTIVCRGRPFCPSNFILDISGRNCTSEISIPAIKTPGETTYNCRAGYTYDPIFHTCRQCQDWPVRKDRTPDKTICPYNGAGQLELNLYTGMCEKTIWVQPLTNFTGVPCNCNDGYYWSHHMLTCVRIEIADCEGNCDNGPNYPYPVIGGPRR